jgi:O-antigen/teichoic acid export membrane protein
MLVSLYTSRVVLNTLGVEDYGIYSLVGGVVASFGFLSSTISSANSRFISFAIGKNDDNYLFKIFSLANTSNILIAIFVLIVCEILGTWWINNKLVIPQDKIALAHIIFQISLLSAIVYLLTSAFLALIISYERMGIFAITQLVQVSLKLVVVIFLPLIHFNSAISYATLLLTINIMFFFYFVIYSKRQFPITNYRLNFSKDLREIFSFSSWDLFGNFSVTMRTEGVRTILSDASFRTTVLDPQGWEPMLMAVPQLDAFLKAEEAKWSKIVRQGNIKL